MDVNCLMGEESRRVPVPECGEEWCVVWCVVKTNWRRQVNAGNIGRGETRSPAERDGQSGLAGRDLGASTSDVDQGELCGPGPINKWLSGHRWAAFEMAPSAGNANGPSLLSRALKVQIQPSSSDGFAVEGLEAAGGIWDDEVLEACCLSSIDEAIDDSYGY